MRVDLRRCDRCHGEYDANQVPEAWNIKRPDGCPIDLCRRCTGIVADIIGELAPPEHDLAEGIHLGAMVTQDHLTQRLGYHATRTMHEINQVREYTDEVAARPLVIP